MERWKSWLQSGVIYLSCRKMGTWYSGAISMIFMIKSSSRWPCYSTGKKYVATENGGHLSQFPQSITMWLDQEMCHLWLDRQGARSDRLRRIPWSEPTLAGWPCPEFFDCTAKTNLADVKSKKSKHLVRQLLMFSHMKYNPLAIQRFAMEAVACDFHRSPY